MKALALECWPNSDFSCHESRGVSTVRICVETPGTTNQKIYVF